MNIENFNYIKVYENILWDFKNKHHNNDINKIRSESNIDGNPNYILSLILINFISVQRKISYWW